MEMLDIAQLQPGRRLARAIFSAEGKLLFLPGETITPEHLETLEQNGIKSVAVASLDSQTASPGVSGISDGFMDEVREMVRERFRLQEEHSPHVKTLFELALERQGRAVLGHAKKVSKGNKNIPSFQTPRPAKANLSKLIASTNQMGTLPTIFQRMVEIINNPHATPTDVAKIIALDPALSAKLLKLVNSPFYGLAAKIDTIPRAVVLVGTRQLVTLAMGATLLTAFRGVPVSLVNMRSFWSHSTSCGAAARIFAKRAGLPQPESFFVSGLLHDIARLLIYTQLPNHALYILTETKRRQESMLSIEQEALGFSHEELGGALLRAWNCPEELIRRVERHHVPLTAASTVEDAVLPAANTVSQALGYGSSGEVCIPPLDSIAWEKMRLSPSVLQECCRTLDNNLRELRSMFTGA